MVIGYQVDEFIHTWFAEHFVAQSHIYAGFTGKVSSLTHFPLEPACEDYFLLDQAVAVFEQGLNPSSWTLSRHLELDVSFEGLDYVTVSKLIQYFSSHAAAFAFWSCSSPDSNTLNPASRKIDQSFYFQTAISVVA